MAKISANGATKVETILSTIVYHNLNANPGPDESVVTYTHTLCSDGRILRKTDGSDKTYRKVAQIKSHVPDPVATFRAYVKRFEAARNG